MVQCSECSGSAVIVTESSYCKEHFVSYFEGKVAATIERFNLISPDDRIIVASSGGKDSTTILYLLNKFYGNVEALAIDEGIPGYRSATLEDLKEFTTKHSIPLHIYSYKDQFGFSLSDALKIRKDVSACYMCGSLRRYLLNQKARSFTKVATGHNLDDEAQSIMMNLVKAQTDLLSRLGPESGNIKDDLFVPRIKPLYLCSEKEIATYALIMGFAPRFTQCPNAKASFRAKIRDVLNEIELQSRGSKRRLVERFLSYLPELKSRVSDVSLSYCSNCREPSSQPICKTCSIVDSISTVNL